MKSIFIFSLIILFAQTTLARAGCSSTVSFEFESVAEPTNGIHYKITAAPTNIIGQNYWYETKITIQPMDENSLEPTLTFYVSPDFSLMSGSYDKWRCELQNTPNRGMSTDRFEGRVSVVNYPYDGSQSIHIGFIKSNDDRVDFDVTYKGNNDIRGGG